MASNPTVTTKNAAIAALMKDADEQDKKRIETARRRFSDTIANWNDIRLDAASDQRFYAGDQYDDSYAQAGRARGNSPRIQVNQLPNFVQQVENNIRQQNIGVTVHATDEKGSEETAEILQGLIRHIQNISNAKLAYLWAAGSHGALVPGFGYIKIEKEWCPPVNGVPSFDQELKIVGIKDPMKILPDFAAQMPDFSDAGYWFEFEEYNKEDYTAKFGKSALAKGGSFSDWGSLGKMIGNKWVKHNSITVAKYWYKEITVRHFAYFEDGTTGFLDDFGLEIDENGDPQVVDKDLHEQTHPTIDLTNDEKSEWMRREYSRHVESGAPESEFPVTEDDIPATRLANVLRVREVEDAHVFWILTNGVEILDRGEWDDSEFPFVAVVGKDEIIDGKRTIHGIVRYAKDSQKMVNFFTSEIVRKVDASNKSAWIAAAPSIPEPQRRRWETSNIDKPAILYYEPYDDDDKPLPPPQRGDSVEPAIQMLMAGSNQMNQNIKATVGIFEAGIGQGIGDRQSGDAIQTLADRGEMANFHFSDNLVISIKRLGYLLLRLIPKVYDTARTVRIIGSDDQAELVKINQMFTKNGKSTMYDIANASNYDVVIDTGPSFASKKSEQMDVLIRFQAANPELAGAIADLVAGNLDVDTSQALVERIQAWQTMTMPALHAANGQPQLPPQARVAFQQMQNQLQQANQHIQTLSQAYQSEKYKNDTQAVLAASKERQLQIKAITDLQLKKMELIAQQATAANKIQLEHVKVQLQHINDKQNIHLKALQLADSATNQTDSNLYAALQNLINNVGTGATPQLPAPQSAGLPDQGQSPESLPGGMMPPSGSGPGAT